MTLRFVLGTLILLLALGLQFSFAGSAMFINFTLASLIVFAFFFDFWELSIFILFSIFVLNWQPAVSLEMVLFVAMPVAAYLFRRMFAWEAWAGIPVAIVASFIVVYLLLSPSLFFATRPAFWIDLLGALFFGGLVFLALDRAKKF